MFRPGLMREAAWTPEEVKLPACSPVLGPCVPPGPTTMHLFPLSSTCRAHDMNCLHVATMRTVAVWQPEPSSQIRLENNRGPTNIRDVASRSEAKRTSYTQAPNVLLTSGLIAIAGT